MNAPFYRFAEVTLFSLLNFLPYILLALCPFRRRMRFSPLVTGCLVVLLSSIQIGIGICSALFAWPYVSVLTAANTILYAAFYFLAVKIHLGKSLFTLLVLSNIANAVTVSAKCLEGLLFGAIAYERYRWTNCLCMAVVLLVVLIPLGIYFYKSYTVSINMRSSGAIWWYLWLVPVTFYFIGYTHLYSQPISAIEVALQAETVFHLLVINLGAFLIYHIVLRLIREQARNMELEERNHQLTLLSLQYDTLHQRITEARQAKHDLRHHIALMTDYLRKGNYAELEQYLLQYQRAVPDDSTIIFCKNHAINALLLYFAQQSKDHAIDFSVHVDIDDSLAITDSDLTVLLGNLLENAIDACSTQNSGDRRIIIRSQQKEDILFLAIDNTFDSPIKQDVDGSYLTTKAKGSGLGLVSVRRITEQYGGVLEINQTQGMFCVSVMLCRPRTETI